MKKSLCHFALLLCSFFLRPAHAQFSVTSPDKTISVLVFTNKQGSPFFSVRRKGDEVLKASALGLVTDKEDFSTHLKLATAKPMTLVKDSYTILNAKKSKVHYTANKKVYRFTNANGNLLEIIFQVSNDGVAFRYYLAGSAGEKTTITSESTSYQFVPRTRCWLQPMAAAKSGWQQTNPSYEEHYKQDVPIGTPSSFGAGWVYPALFKTGANWLLITEAGMEGDYCASRLQCDSGSSIYKVAFPDPREVVLGGGLLPKLTVPAYSPWRIITLGSLATITESTLGTDLAKPAIPFDTAYVKPGKASWSWINSKDDFIVYDEQVKYIDFAAAMKWRYCLIDADWDRKIGYDKIKELAAASKNVGLLLWYNSAGDWNTVKYTPKNLLLTPGSRSKEFARLQAMGIKGVKIDFFGGDGQSVIQYYNDILKDAARYNLLVNFHGATLPRGWARTYPNLMSTEAVRGFEMVTFGQQDADAEANHCAMLPFTRNVFDPMDFTPVNLYKIQTKVQRKTTSAFELATSVLFLSGIQHYAESPEGMKHVPQFVQDFLQELPNNWDDVKFVAGFPGKLAVIARLKGDTWYIAGINGEETEKKIMLDLPWLKGKMGTLISDGREPLSFEQEPFTMPASGKFPVTLKSNGGFVIVF